MEVVRMSKRGRPVTKESEAKKDKVVELYQSGKRLSLAEIGQMVGVTRARVSQILQERGIAAEDGWIDMSAELEQVLRLGNLSENDLADLLDVAPKTLKGWRRGEVNPEIRFQRRITTLLTALEHARSLLK
jgi:transcriptional regulator with XRE-family HTH domain